MRYIRQFGQPRPEKPPERRIDWLTLAPTVVALTAVMAQMTGSFQQTRLQVMQLEVQSKLKEYELSFKPKQEAYTAFMDATNQICSSKNEGDVELFGKKLQYAFYGIEPFLKSSTRTEVMNLMKMLRPAQMGESVQLSKDLSVNRSCSELQGLLHEQLSEALFTNVSPDIRP